jgi:hypothetical protein
MGKTAFPEHKLFKRRANTMENEQKSEALVLVGKVETALPPSDYLRPTTEEVYLTLARDKKLLEKGSTCQLARIYDYLASIYDIAKENRVQPLGNIAKGAGLKAPTVRQYINRACQLLRENQMAVMVVHDWSGMRNGEYHTAKRGNPVKGVTFQPLKDASVDAVREVREGKVNPLLLSAQAESRSLNG